ncbi:unnamed protein product [Heterobilharzia americana]|nr:unnamed protein product [Heterobilharzia americana]
MSNNSVPDCQTTSYSYTKKEIRVICVLIAILIPFYISVEISSFICDQYTFYSDEVKLRRQDAQRQTSLVQSSNNFAAVAPGLISTLVVGYLYSYSREAIQILAVAIVVFYRLTPWGLVVSNVLEGFIGGGLLSAIAQFSVCIADLTNYDQRQGCDLARKAVYDRRRWLLLTLIDGLACLSLATANMIAVILIFFLPETNDKKHLIHLCTITECNTKNVTVDLCNHQSVSFKNDLPTENSTRREKLQRKIQQIMKAVMSSHPVLIIILVILFLVSISAMVDSPFSTVYLMSEPFWWNSKTLGLTNGIIDSCSSLLSITIVNILARYHRPNMVNKKSVSVNDTENSCNIVKNKVKADHDFQKTLFNLLISALSLMLINRILMTLAYLPSSTTANIVVYIALATKMARNINFPLLRTLITKWSSKQRQGLILSFGSFISRIGLLISVSALPLVYSATLSHFPGAVFLVCASLLFIGLCAAISLHFVVRRENSRCEVSK